MLKQLWQKWTVDKPAALGDLLWEVLVVRLAALLDRLTLRRTIAFIPFVILVLAYTHQIALPPELMLAGDVLAYIDIISVILLLGFLARVTAVWLFAKQAVEHAVKLASRVLVRTQRFDFRHKREGNVRSRKRLTGRTKLDDDYPVFEGAAWA
jgi:hypothetical protein